MSVDVDVYEASRTDAERHVLSDTVNAFLRRHYNLDGGPAADEEVREARRRLEEIRRVKGPLDREEDDLQRLVDAARVEATRREAQDVAEARFRELVRDAHDRNPVRPATVWREWIHQHAGSVLSEARALEIVAEVTGLKPLANPRLIPHHAPTYPER